MFAMYGLTCTNDSLKSFVELMGNASAEAVNQAIKLHMQDEKTSKYAARPIDLLKLMESWGNSYAEYIWINPTHPWTGQKHEKMLVRKCETENCEECGTNTIKNGEPWYCSKHYKEIKGF